ncbi:MAG: ECF transporter S component [Firmicutes bacterium]|nr:ECF transporter S component [Bacillota bacterium]MCL5038295.1 ECF transporter S component [Bacillota bacterium]
MSKVRNLVVTAILGAAAFYLMFALEFPLPLFPTYLKYDPGEIPALLGAFALGPMAGLAVEVIKNALYFLSGKSTAGLVGVSANLVAGATFVLSAGLIYRWRHDTWGALTGLFAGSLATTLVMSLANYYVFLPLWGVPRNQLLPLLTGAIIPFNLVKGFLSALVTALFYRRVEAYILGKKSDWQKINLAPSRRPNQ